MLVFVITSFSRFRSSVLTAILTDSIDRMQTVYILWCDGNHWQAATVDWKNDIVLQWIPGHPTYLAMKWLTDTLRIRWLISWEPTVKVLILFLRTQHQPFWKRHQGPLAPTCDCVEYLRTIVHEKRWKNRFEKRLWGCSFAFGIVAMAS